MPNFAWWRKLKRLKGKVISDIAILVRKSWLQQLFEKVCFKKSQKQEWKRCPLVPAPVGV